MGNMVRSVIQQDVAVAASTTLTPIILPVNPLSFLLFTVRSLNDTGTIAAYEWLDGMMAFFSNIEVRFKGHVIIGGRLRNLAILNGLLTGFVPVQGNVGETDDDTRFVTFMLSFSRRPYWREEAFPAVRSGELTLHIESAAAQGGFDGVTIQVETVELLGVNPSRFLKYTTQTAVFAATGQNDIDLPIGNPILGVLLDATTVPITTSFNSTAGQMRILVDNVETDYTLTNWETLHGELGRRLKGQYDWLGHRHSVNAGGAGQEDSQSAQHDAESIENFAYMDFDPLEDMSYALVTEGKSRVQLRVTADVADTLRIIPVEMFNVAGLPQRVGATAR